MSKSVSKQFLYSLTSVHAKKAIERVAQLIESDNETVALGACKLLLNKTLPDIKTLELQRIEAIDAEIKTEVVDSAKKLNDTTKGGFGIWDFTKSLSVSEAKELIEATQ
jgi:hypothetical protein